MNQEQKIEQARIAGLYLFGMTMTLMTFIWSIWRQWSLIPVWLTMTCFCFFLYRSLITGAYPLVSYALKKYWKCNRIHDFFQRKHKNKDKHKILRDVWNSQKDKVKEVQEIETQQSGNYTTESSLQKDQQKTEELIMESHRRKNTLANRLVFYPKKVKEVPTKFVHAETAIERQTKIKQQLSAREAYKLTLGLLGEKGIKQKWFEQFCALARGDYSLKVQQLLMMSQQNQERLVSVIEEMYYVKVMFEYSGKVPQRLQPIHIDEAVSQVRLVRVTGCLPWEERQVDQFNRKTVLKTLTELVQLRDRLDKALSPDMLIRHKQRSQLTNTLKSQLKGHGASSKALLMVVMALYNQNVKAKEYQMVVGSQSGEEEGIQVVEKQVGGHFHADLKVWKEGKRQDYCIKSGEENVWCLLGVAAQIYRLRL